MSNKSAEGADPENAAGRRPTRAERSEQTREALEKAAGEIVGEVGYQEASIAKITARAGIAQGTFYNYFESRQELFRELLPGMGAEMVAFISEKLSKDARGANRERERMTAYLEFQKERPAFYRILYEAATLAPEAHNEHVRKVVEGYTRSLRRSLERGEMPDYDESELETIAYMLIAIRDYLSMRYGRDEADPCEIEKIIGTYTKMINGGLFRDSDI